MGHMGIMGLLVAALAPVLVVGLGRRDAGWERWALPARIAGPGFVLLHDGLTVATALAPPPPLVAAGLDLLLLAGALLFWAPVLGQRFRLPDALRTVYLFTALPLLDAAAVYLVITGDNAGGLTMITTMIPMGLIAVAVTWNWINREERRAVAAELVAERGIR
jgi:hypothetical protein